jgi:hypothetical protein
VSFRFYHDGTAKLESFKNDFGNPSDDLSMINLVFRYFSERFRTRFDTHNWHARIGTFKDSHVFVHRNSKYWSENFKALNDKYLPEERLSLHSVKRSLASNIFLAYGPKLAGVIQARDACFLTVSQDRNYIENIRNDIQQSCFVTDGRTGEMVFNKYLTSISGFYDVAPKTEAYRMSFDQFLPRLGITP